MAMMESALTDPASSSDQFETMLASYFDEKHVEGWEMSRLLSQAQLSADESSEAVFELLKTGLLTGRNQSWVPVILDNTTGDYVVVAVGAAHLGGSEGLLNLLKSQGFTLTRLPF